MASGMGYMRLFVYLGVWTGEKGRPLGVVIYISKLLLVAALNTALTNLRDWTLSALRGKTSFPRHLSSFAPSVSCKALMTFFPGTKTCFAIVLRLAIKSWHVMSVFMCAKNNVHLYIFLWVPLFSGAFISIWNHLIRQSCFPNVPQIRRRYPFRGSCWWPARSSPFTGNDWRLRFVWKWSRLCWRTQCGLWQT